jgi:hypothetical protein
VQALGKLYAAPFGAGAVLIVEFKVDVSALLPFRLISELANTIASTQTAMSTMQEALLSSRISQSSTEAALVSTQTSTQAALSSMQDALLSSQISQSSTEDALTSTQAALSSIESNLATTQADVATVGETVCNQPVCSAGTRADNGTCVPDCPDLRRRGLGCQPFCDAVNVDVTPPSGGDDHGSSPSSDRPIELIFGIIAALLAVAAVIGVIVHHVRSARSRSMTKVAREPSAPPKQQTVTMFMNPLHPGFDPTAVPSHVECVAPVQDYEEPNGVRLDSELYVQMADATNKQANQETNKERASAYTLFRAPAAEASLGGSEGTYSLFRAPLSGRNSAQANVAPTYSLFGSVDAAA